MDGTSDPEGIKARGDSGVKESGPIPALDYKAVSVKRSLRLHTALEIVASPFEGGSEDGVGRGFDTQNGSIDGMNLP